MKAGDLHAHHPDHAQRRSGYHFDEVVPALLVTPVRLELTTQ